MERVKHLEVSGLSHDFGPVKVLSNIDFEILPGQSVAVVGPSGGGKSTLLRLCAGLLDVEDGTVHNSFARCSFAFQDTRLLPWATALDNIAFGLKACGESRRSRHQQARNMALRLGLSEIDLDKFPADLSGGMRQRVSFSRALLTLPDLLFLDEPFSALDIGLKQELQQVLLDDVVQRGTAILFITHDLMEAVRLADSVLVLAGTPGQIACRFDFSLPPSERSDSYVHEQTAKLLADPKVIEHFELRVRPGI